MRASPRTWPSIRLSRFRHGALISVRMIDIYPPRVCACKPAGTEMAAMPSSADASPHGKPRAHAAVAHGGHAVAAGATAVDPGCSMNVDPRTTPHRPEHRGRTYYFCSAGCRSKFAADPAKYLT